MGNVKEKHPSWFKMKLERRELIRQLPPETAVKVLLACWEYLESEVKPNGLSLIENVAFSSFMPDMEEAWGKYMKRVSGGAKGGRPKSEKPYGSICPHAVPYGTEEESETESETEAEDRESRAAKQPKRPSRFVPPTVEEVRAYCAERQNSIGAELFVDFYQTRGWTVGKGKMKDWRAAVRTWESRDRTDRPREEAPPKAVRFTLDEFVTGGGSANE